MKKASKRRTGGADRPKRKRVSLKQLYLEPLPAAITGRINPLLYIGIACLVFTLLTLILSYTRGIAPFSALLSLTILGYATWQRYDVVSKGYKEILFKVIDYTYLTRLNRKPTGILLVKKDPGPDEEKGDLYHIATSGKEDMPPVGWNIRVYVPENMEPTEYNGRKFYPTVFGYKLEGEDED